MYFAPLHPIARAVYRGVVVMLWVSIHQANRYGVMYLFEASIGFLRKLSEA